MAKKTMNFYSPTDESRILNAFQTLKGKARRDALSGIAKTLGRSYSSVYAKGNALNKASKKAGKVKTSKTNPAKEARVTGSTIRFPYRSIEIDAGTQEIVVKL